MMLIADRGMPTASLTWRKGGEGRFRARLAARSYGRGVRKKFPDNYSEQGENHT